MSYYCLDLILTDNQKIPCSFYEQVPGYGFLSRATEKILPPNVEVELPYYIAEQLVLNGLVDMKEPSCFSQKVRDDLDASYIAVNLHSLCPNFYTFGAKMLNLIDDDELLNNLITTYKSRLLTISDYTQTSKLIIDRFTFVDSLDESEKDVYKKGYESEISIRNWMKKTTANKKT
ncbi:DNA replication protein [Lobulomyces angularis]|nr:DNA replication protein [Lobulomyces angularis]